MATDVETKAGPELDCAVAEAMGWARGTVDAAAAFFWFSEDGIAQFPVKEFKPSTDLNVAFAAAEKVGLFMCDTQDGPGTNLRLFRGGGGFWWITNGNRRPVVQFSARTPALAICAAILKLKEKAD